MIPLLKYKLIYFLMLEAYHCIYKGDNLVGAMAKSPKERSDEDKRSLKQLKDELRRKTIIKTK